MFKPDVSLMLLQPRVHGTACLPNVDHAALAVKTSNPTVKLQFKTL
jgi:hypothetical protein